MRAILLLLAMTAHASAGDIEFSYENFQKTRIGTAEVVLKFKNTTGRTVEYAIAKCALMDESERAITVVTVAATNVEGHGVAYAKAYGPNDDRIAKVLCRMDD